MTDTAFVNDVLGRFENVKPAGPGRWMARCPAHDDRTASLSIALGTEGRLLLCCQAHCETRDVCRAARMEMKDLFPPKNGHNGHNGHNAKPKRIAKTYAYTTRDGELLYEVVRYEPKDFRQRRADDNGGWVWKLDGVSRVLYRLPELMDADPAEWVYLVEGEKDVDRLTGLGLAATTCAQGAGKWRPEYSEALRGRRVVILPDNDAPGTGPRRHGRRVAERHRRRGPRRRPAGPADEGRRL